MSICATSSSTAARRTDQGMAETNALSKYVKLIKEQIGQAENIQSGELSRPMDLDFFVHFIESEMARRNQNLLNLQWEASVENCNCDHLSDDVRP
uniref:Uncharacterized protein n=1 Tax=Kalanchoe fedtschenkoi TaxID=63787 RepID=A0A7N0UPK4_KALFE